MSNRVIEVGDDVHTPLGEGVVLEIVHHGKSFVVGLGGRKTRRYRRDQITSLEPPLQGWRPPQSENDPLWPLEGQLYDRGGDEAELGVWYDAPNYTARKATPPPPVTRDQLPSQARPDRTQGPSAEDERWLRENLEAARPVIVPPPTRVRSYNRSKW